MARKVTSPNDSLDEHELREAFRRSGLWRRGWTYAQAIKNEGVLTGLRCTVQAHRRAVERRGEHLPAQLGLI